MTDSKRPTFNARLVHDGMERLQKLADRHKSKWLAELVTEVGNMAKVSIWLADALEESREVMSDLTDTVRASRLIGRASVSSAADIAKQGKIEA